MLKKIVEIHNQFNRSKMVIKLIDLFDSEQRAAGLKVEVHIPVGYKIFE